MANAVGIDLGATNSAPPGRLAYQVEGQLRELGDRAPANARVRAGQLIAETRSLVKNGPSNSALLQPAPQRPAADSARVGGDRLGRRLPRAMGSCSRQAAHAPMT